MGTTLAKDNISRAHISAMVPSFWSDLMQVPLRKSLVAAAVANTRFEAKLSKGDTIHFPYLSETEAEDYTPGSTIIVNNASATDESLVVDEAKVVANYIDDVEAMQANYSYQLDIADNAGYKLKDAIDTAVLSHVSAAASGLYYASSAAPISHAAIATVTAGAAITATSANIIEVFASARKALRKQNVEEAGDWCVVTTPEVAMAMEIVGTEKGFSVADATLRNGFAGKFLGFEIYISNNLPANYNYFGRKGMIHLAVQAPPKMQIKDVSDLLGKNLIASTVYGTKAFTRYKSRFLTVKITA
jgi:hypothetical protein